MKRSPRLRLAGLALTAALVAAACSGGSDTGTDQHNTNSGDAIAAAAGDPVPTVSFRTFAGEPATLDDYQGKPLVVNFWASWCPSCVAEMSAAFVPAQLQLGDEVAFLGMNIQDDRDRALQLVEETGVLFDLAEDPTGELYAELGGLGMPFTVYISSDGQVLDVHNGPLTEDQLVNQITEVLLS